MVEIQNHRRIYNFEEDGVAMSMYNIDSSIYGLQDHVNRALDKKMASLFINKKYNS